MSPRKGKKKGSKSKEDHRQGAAATGEAPRKSAPAQPESGEAESKDRLDPAFQEDLIKKAQERDEFLDRLQRTTAEFSNYQKRVQREVEETRKYAAGPVALDLLGVLDNLRRALEAAEGKLDNGFLEGFRMIETQFLDVLQKHHITPVEAVNQPFDPNYHDAMMEVVDPSLPDKTVVEELEKGYLLHDRLLRPTRVRVSRQPSPEKEDQGKGELKRGEKDQGDGEKDEENKDA